MKKLFSTAWPLALLFGVVSVVGCSRQDKAVLANIGSRSITLNEFKERIQQLPPQYQSMIQNENDKKMLLDALVKEQLIVQEARERNIDKDKAIRNKIETVVNQVLLEEMVQKARTSQLKPTDGELKSYYDEHQKDYSGPERIKVAHILIKEKPEAEKILAQLKAGVDFSKLAREKSGDRGSAEKGGEMDYFSRGDMVPEFEKAAFELQKPGQLSGLVKSSFGYHIIKLIDKKPAGLREFDECKNDLLRIVEKEKFEKWMESLKTKWHVKVNYDKLKELNVASTPQSPSEGVK